MGKRNTSEFKTALTTLTDRLTAFLTGKISSNTLGYDTNWGGVIASLGKGSESLDNGNAFYFNHHIQYGYLLFAAAVVARYTPSFLTANKSVLYLLARDIVNPSSKDSSFPRWRHKDWYTGRSYSSGLSSITTLGKDASNVAEAVNGYLGAYYLGLAFNDKLLITTAQVLLATEVRSAKTYYQYSVERMVDIIPPFDQVLTVNSWQDLQYKYGLNVNCNPNVFPQRHACILATIVRPFSPVSNDLIQPAWVFNVQNNLYQALMDTDNGSLYDGWRAYAWMTLSLLPNSGTAAWDAIEQLDPTQMVPGNTLTNSLFWTLADIEDNNESSSSEEEIGIDMVIIEEPKYHRRH